MNLSDIPVTPADCVDAANQDAAFYAERRMTELLRPYRSRDGRVMPHTACRDGDCPNCPACVAETYEAIHPDCAPIGCLQIPVCREGECRRETEEES